MVWIGIALASWGLVVWLALPQCIAVVDRAITAYTTVHSPAVAPAASKPVPIPGNVLSIAYRYPDDFARESVIGRARELYEESNDWGTVAYQLEQESGV